MLSKTEKNIRNSKVYDLKNSGVSNKEISKTLGLNRNTVSTIISRGRESGDIKKFSKMRPYQMASYRTQLGSEELGRMKHMCDHMGNNVINWVLDSKPDDLNFAQYIGVLIKDQYLWYESMRPSNYLEKNKNK